MPRKKAAYQADIRPWLSARNDCREGRFLQIGNSLLLSRAFQNLTANARILYLALAMEAGGKRDVIISRSHAQKYGIKQYFDLIITTKDIGVGKSKPDIYDISRSRLGTDHAETVIFEDAHYAIETAKKSGYTVIAIDDYWQFRKKEDVKSIADRYIYNWAEIYDLIEI